MTEEKRGEILLALQNRGALGPCPTCGFQGRIVKSAYVGTIFSETPKFPFQIGPAPAQHAGVITCALVECPRCGFIATHNMATLGVESQ